MLYPIGKYLFSLAIVSFLQDKPASFCFAQKNDYDSSKHVIVRKNRREYTQLPLQGTPIEYSIDSVYGEKKYRLGDLTIMVGESVSQEAIGGKWIIIKDEAGKVCYKARVCDTDSYVCEPIFYQSSQTKSPVLLFIRTGFEIDLGYEVFLVNKNEITYAGFIDAAVDEDFLPLLPHASIFSKGKKLKITFTEDVEVFISPDTENEKRYHGNKVIYVIKNYRKSVKAKLHLVLL